MTYENKAMLRDGNQMVNLFIAPLKSTIGIFSVFHSLLLFPSLLRCVSSKLRINHKATIDSFIRPSYKRLEFTAGVDLVGDYVIMS